MSSCRWDWVLGIEDCISVKREVSRLFAVFNFGCRCFSTLGSLSLVKCLDRLSSLIWTRVIRIFMRCLNEWVLDQSARAERTYAWYIKDRLLALFLCWVTAASRLKLLQFDWGLLLHVRDRLRVLRNFHVWERLWLSIWLELLLLLFCLPLVIEWVWSIKALGWDLRNAAAANVWNFFALGRVNLFALSWRLSKV